MLPQRLKKTITDNPKKLGNLIDLVNLPSKVREFVGQSQISRLGYFMCVWSYIKTNSLQDPYDKNVVNCDEKLKSILLGKARVELSELPSLIRLHFPKEPKWFKMIVGDYPDFKFTSWVFLLLHFATCWICLAVKLEPIYVIFWFWILSSSNYHLVFLF